MQIKVPVEIVVNTCEGAFDLSPRAAIKVLELCEIPFAMQDDMPVLQNGLYLEDVITRNNPHLVGVVKEMAEQANGPFARLQVQTVYAIIDIQEIDGKETALFAHILPEIT